jgi:hypothetical protein
VGGVISGKVKVPFPLPISRQGLGTSNQCRAVGALSQIVPTVARLPCTLIPVMVGGGAHVRVDSLFLEAFNYAMLSNVARSASRGIVGKRTMRARALGRLMNAMVTVLTILAPYCYFLISPSGGPVIRSSAMQLVGGWPGPVYLYQVLAAALFITHIMGSPFCACNVSRYRMHDRKHTQACFYHFVEYPCLSEQDDTAEIR